MTAPSTEIARHQPSSRACLGAMFDVYKSALGFPRPKPGCTHELEGLEFELYDGRCSNNPLIQPPYIASYGVLVPYLRPTVCDRHATYDERVLHLYVEMTVQALGARWFTADRAERVRQEAAAAVARERQAAVQRLKLAEDVFGPPLGDPACLAWEVTDEDRAVVVDAPSLLRWQNYRCAICAGFTEKFQLDHDHATGNARGWLCASCNVREGRPREATYLLYRKLNPAAMFGLELPYSRAKQRRPAA